MSRPFLPSAVLTVLALTSNVRPRFMEEWPQLADANTIARGRKVVAQLSNACRCVGRGCRV
jgi:hypothetical protein